MTDLHLDNKQLDIHVTRNLYQIRAKTYLPPDTIGSTWLTVRYDHVYLPMTLERCLVLNDAVIFKFYSPYWENEIHFQDIEITGKDIDMISMDDYFELRKKEKSPT